MYRALFVALLSCLFASPALALPAFTIEGVIGFAAEAEFDEVTGGGMTLQGSDDDLESNLGVQVTYAARVGGKFEVGGRAALINGELDDANDDL